MFLESSGWVSYVSIVSHLHPYLQPTSLTVKSNARSFCTGSGEKRSHLLFHIWWQLFVLQGLINKNVFVNFYLVHSWKVSFQLLSRHRMGDLWLSRPFRGSCWQISGHIGRRFSYKPLETVRWSWLTPAPRTTGSTSIPICVCWRMASTLTSWYR